MKMKTLGRTGIKVSELCLGSMTWGTQNTAEEGFDQIERALDAGINFIDTAEMYPVNPVSAETVGRTELIIGLWNEDRNRRSDYILATKHSGEGMMHRREGAPISSETIPEAIDDSLRRLQTDYIDLYQFHWPNRGSYMFRKNWDYDPSSQNRAETMAHMEDCMGALQDEVTRGTIRAFGRSGRAQDRPGVRCGRCLSGHRAAARAGPGANGAGVVLHAALHGIGDFRGDVVGPA